jgi:cytochrome o ubiquinol oxidase subunit 1
MFGKLTIAAFQHDPIVMGGILGMFGGIFTVIAVLTYFKRWKWLWREWLTSVDPKKIGVMYLVVAGVMLLRGLADVTMLRLQQALGHANSFLTADHFQQVFSAHGTIMIFFVAMGLMFGILNLIVPLQIGARDVAFPFLNSTSFWLYVAGVILINMSLVVGEFAATGWLAYPPLSELVYSPGVGVDYWIWSLQISGIGSMLSGINFLVTILKMRAPGMTLMKMPMFIWSVLCSMILVAFSFPILTATLTLLFLDRYLGMHFFTTTFGGNPMMYVNLIWAWGHPEVYILILPAFGIFSEIVSTFSQKKLFGYKSMVYALASITVLSFLVWLHHFFTMGSGANVNAFFGIMTMIISIPTGVKVFNWLFTMYRGRVRFTTPMLWFMGFIVTFTIGGMTGVLMAVPAVDFQLHNSLFLVAHFHNVIIGGVVFGYFAGASYWFPKFTGFKLNEKLGHYAFWCWIIGFIFAFIPLYILGIMGATRRLDHYDPSMGWQWLFGVAGVGVLIICAGVGFQILQLVVSILQRRQSLDTTGDPWNGRTLEWSTSSPPPFYNFAFIPEITDRDAFWVAKNSDEQPTVRPYEDIHMPKDTPMGIYIAGICLVVGFAIVWHITWLILLGLVGIIACIVLRSLDANTSYYVTAAEVERKETELANKIY